MLRITIFLLSLTVANPVLAQNVKLVVDINALLIAAVSGGDAETVKSLLDRGADVNTKDDKGCPALICAVSKGKSETVKVLLDKGADVNSTDNKGSTALMVAQLNKDAQITQLLKDAAAESKTTVAEPVPAARPIK